MTKVVATALAPLVWGTSYAVATEYLPGFDPFLVAALRALPAGLLLIALSRVAPPRAWWLRTFVLGTLNIGLFFGLLFFAAYRLPGGVVATVGAVQPLVVMLLSCLVLGEQLRPGAIGCALAGFVGVGLLVATPTQAFDAAGLAAAFGAALSMASGIVLSRRWGVPLPLTAYTGWQLVAGGIVLALLAALRIDVAPSFDARAILGLGWLALVGAALAYLVWFRGLQQLRHAWQVSILGLLSPLVAVAIGWLFLGQSLTPLQLLGAVLVAASVVLTQLPIVAAASDPT